MNDDLPIVISGTRRQIRELVDGSLEVRIHIDPRFKADFHRLFPNIDLPVAIAPLEANFERTEQEEKQKGGQLARLAGIWCKDAEFQKWLSTMYQENMNEEDAADWIRDVCEVSSRSELDSNEHASEIFHKRVRLPYMDWLKNLEELKKS